MVTRSVQRALVLAAATTIAFLGASTAGAAAHDPQHPGTVEGPGLSAIPYVNVKNKRSGLCLQVGNRSSIAGAWVVQRTCAGDQSQQWQVIDLRNGYVQVRVRRSSQCLEVNQADGSKGLGDNARVLQWGCHGGEQQQWKQTEVGGGFFEFRNRRSLKCLEVDQRIGGGRANGGAVVQRPCHRGAQQQWKLR
jgi:hypothetical protein